MKKIIFVVDFLRTIQAGTEHQLAHLLWNLPHRQFEVMLVSLQDSPFLKDKAKQLFPEVRIESLGGESDISKSLSSLVALYRIFRSEKPDIVHTFFPTSNSVGILLAKLAGIHTLISSRRDMGFNLSTMDVIKLKTANCFISCIIANADAVKNKTIALERVSPQKIVVIRNGIKSHSLSENRNDNGAETPIVAIVANLNRDVKRVDVFVKAAAIVGRHLPHTRFWVIGEGHLKEGLEKLAVEEGSGENILFLGRRSDVAELLNRVTVGVLSSDSEGLSNAIMEYMAKGIPAVVTNVGGNAELVRDGRNGYVVPPGNPEAMADAILRLVQHPEKAVRMGNEGFKMIGETFSVPFMVDRTIGVYNTF